MVGVSVLREGEGSNLWREHSLGELAGRVGWSGADIMAVSGVSKSAIARWWSDRQWLDRASAAGVQMLSQTVPGVQEYVDMRGQFRAIERAATACEAAGLELIPDAVDDLVRGGVRAAELVPALLAGAAVAAASDSTTGTERLAIQALARCWGAPADRATDALFLPAHAGGIFADSGTLVTGAQRLQSRRGDDVADVVGRGIALHKLIKHVSEDPGLQSRTTGGGLASAFRYRSTVIGRILADNDELTVLAYRRQLMRDPALQWNEVWSLATYAGDLPRDRVDRYPIRKGAFRKTASRILADLESAGESYRGYLLTCAVPLLVSHDPTFGNQRSRLTDVVEKLTKRPDTESNATATLREIRT